jgi:hypothetical protein
MMEDIEQRVRDVAKRAAQIRWNLPAWDGTNIHITRIEQVDAVSWSAYYTEPDTGTEETMSVERVGNILEASYTEDVLARLPMEEKEA